MGNAELGMIIKACLILHNMIVVDERDLYDLTYDYDDVKDNTRNLMLEGTIICATQPIFLE